MAKSNGSGGAFILDQIIKIVRDHSVISLLTSLHKNCFTFLFKQESEKENINRRRVTTDINF